MLFRVVRRADQWTGLHVQQAELESVIGVVDDGLDLTLSRILADPVPREG